MVEHELRLCRILLDTLKDVQDELGHELAANGPDEVKTNPILLNKERVFLRAEKIIHRAEARLKKAEARLKKK